MDERERKISALLGGLAKTQSGMKMLERALSASGLSLMRQAETTPFPTVKDPRRLAEAGEGVILDCETTGLVPEEEGVTQVAMYKIRYDERGILSLDEFFDGLNDPGKPIPPEVTELTGITDEMVSGKRITDQQIADFMGDADLAIAHNAEFDRKMLEHHFPAAGFDRMRWDCSLKQVDWKGRMMGSGSLELLALKCGIVYGSHNAASDIRATAFVLNAPGVDERPTAFQEMYANGSQGYIHIFAQDASFNVKDKLSGNGYRWAPANEPISGYGKVWHKQMPASPELMAAEAEFLSTEIYGREKSLPALRFDGRDAYSIRAGSERVAFRTAEHKGLTANEGRSELLDRIGSNVPDPDLDRPPLPFG